MSHEQVNIRGMFEDIVGDIFSKKLYSVAYTVDYDWDENAIKFQPNGDIDNKNKRIQWNVQIPHGAKIGEGSYFRMHFHWWQDNVQGTFVLRYRKQYNSKSKTSAWTDLTVTTGTASSKGAMDIYDCSGVAAPCNQLTQFAEIDISDMDISDTLQFMLTRTDSNSGNIWVYFIDAHILLNSRGSQTEWYKNRKK